MRVRLHFTAQDLVHIRLALFPSPPKPGEHLGVHAKADQLLDGPVKTDWKRFRALTGKDIRAALEADPEARPTDVNFWKKAKVALPQPKQTITIRLDADVLGWLRRQKGYQTRINAVLRTYMEAQEP